MVTPQTAPTLPKGWFFRVKKDYVYRYVVSLRQKLFLGLSREFDFWATDNPDEVHYLMEKLKGQLERKAQRDAEAATVYGDYPPKKNIGGKD